MNARLARLVGRWLPSLVATATVLAVVSPAGSDAMANAQAPTSNLEVILVLDVSASMRPAIESAKVAAVQFIDSMPAQVSIGLETFGDEVKLLTPPTTDRELLRNLIEGISLEEDTALYDAVIAAAGQFSPTVPEKVIVLLSDGRDEGSQAPLDYAVASLQGIQVEAISLTTSQTDLASLSALGSVTAADDAAGMALAFDRVASLLAAVVAPTAPSTSPATTAAPTTSAAPSTTTAMTVPNTSTEVSQSDTVATAIDVPDPSNMPVVVGAAAVFLALFLIVVLAWPEPRVSKARLGIEDKKSVSDFGRRTASIVETALERQGRRTEFATTLAVADIPMRPGEFVGLVGVIALVSGSVVLLVGGPIAAIAVALAIYLSARWYVSQRTERRRQAFAEQLPDVMQLVTTALRSGFGLSQALDAVAEEAEEPARSEFAQVLTETRLGRDLPSAMRALADRMKSDDLAWVVSAIDINRDIGGNLSEVLSSVGTTIRERQRMARQVATYTAEGRLSARVLTVLPFVMAFWQWRANPDTFSRLFEGGGLTALIIAAVLLIVGSFWVRRIVNSISA